MEDNLIFFKSKTASVFQMEDNLNFLFSNRIKPHFSLNEYNLRMLKDGRQTQFNSTGFGKPN
jgi:hypothetical protein